FSSSLPSHQTIWSGWQSSADFWIHFRRCGFFVIDVSGTAIVWGVAIAGFLPRAVTGAAMPAARPEGAHGHDQSVTPASHRRFNRALPAPAAVGRLRH